MNQNQEGLHLAIELLIKTGKDIQERMGVIKMEPHGSQEQKIQIEVLNKYLIQDSEELASLLYSVILSYNESPERLQSLTNQDILKAQIALDDFVNILKSTGTKVNIQFKKDDGFKGRLSSLQN